MWFNPERLQNAITAKPKNVEQVLNSFVTKKQTAFAKVLSFYFWSVKIFQRGTQLYVNGHIFWYRIVSMVIDRMFI